MASASWYHSRVLWSRNSGTQSTPSTRRTVPASLHSSPHTPGVVTRGVVVVVVVVVVVLDVVVLCVVDVATGAVGGGVGGEGHPVNSVVALVEKRRVTKL